VSIGTALDNVRCTNDSVANGSEDRRKDNRKGYDDFESFHLLSLLELIKAGEKVEVLEYCLVNVTHIGEDVDCLK